VRLVAFGPAVSVDPKGKAAGRGAYLCPDPSCWATAERKRALEGLRIAFPDQSEAWRRRTGRRSFANLGRSALELAAFDRIPEGFNEYEMRRAFEPKKAS